MILDLGHTLHRDVARAPVLAAPTIDTVTTQLPCPTGELGQPTISVTRAGMPVHFGTHVDAQNHLFDGGRPIERYPVERFVGPAEFVDLRHLDDREVTVSDLEESSLSSSGLAIVVLVFGRSALFGEEPARYLEQPWLSTEAAQWIVDRGTTLLGMDVLTPDLPGGMRPEDFDFPVHRTLLGADVLVMENVGGAVEHCLGQSVELLCAPVALRGADGGHTRPLARIS